MIELWCFGSIVLLTRSIKMKYVNFKKVLETDRFLIPKNSVNLKLRIGASDRFSILVCCYIFVATVI